MSRRRIGDTPICQWMDKILRQRKQVLEPCAEGLNLYPLTGHNKSSLILIG